MCKSIMKCEISIFLKTFLKKRKRRSLLGCFRFLDLLEIRKFTLGSVIGLTATKKIDLVRQVQISAEAVHVQSALMPEGKA